MTEQPLSARAYAAAQSMYESDHRGAPPRPEDFTHLDAAAPPAVVEPEQPSAPAPAPEPGWDVSAFAALPSETRAAVLAGTAAERGSTFLEAEAEAELLRAGDVHRYLTDPAKYVDQAGRVDRTMIRVDLEQLVRDRPELARYGNRPGQDPARPDERRRAAPGSAVGATPTSRAINDRVAEVKAIMEGGSGVRFR